MKRDETPDAKPPNDGKLFDATRWSLVMRAKDKSASALETLCQTYRAPLLVLVGSRRITIPGHDAEDLVQGFFEHLFKRDFLAHVAENKGRFRTFLLTSFDHYLNDLRRRERAAKRGGGTAPDSLDETDAEGQPLHDPPSAASSPDEEVQIAWLKALIAAALHRLAEECAATGHAALFKALEPVLYADEDALSSRQIAEKLGMTEGNVNVAAHRIRKRLNRLIREEARETVSNGEDLEDELAFLLNLLKKRDPGA